MFCDPLVAHITEVDLPPAALERAKGRHNRHADPEDEQDDPHWRSTTRITIFPAIDVYTTEQRSGVNVCTLSIQIAASWPEPEQDRDGGRVALEHQRVIEPTAIELSVTTRVGWIERWSGF